MARKVHEDALGVAGAETVIGTGVKLKGNLLSESDLSIDGQLNGDITAQGNVNIGLNARIKGHITAGNITIAGQVIGNVTVDGEANILSTGQVRGDVTAGSLAITSGGIFIGTSRMPNATADSSTESVEPQN